MRAKDQHTTMDVVRWSICRGEFVSLPKFFYLIVNLRCLIYSTGYFVIKCNNKFGLLYIFLHKFALFPSPIEHQFAVAKYGSYMDVICVKSHEGKNSKQ